MVDLRIGITLGNFISAIFAMKLECAFQGSVASASSFRRRSHVSLEVPSSALFGSVSQR
jgi:hypothetical protein